MSSKELPKLDYARTAEFAHYCRRVALEEGALIVTGLFSADLQSFTRLFGDVVKQHDGNDTFDVKPSAESIYHSRTMDAVPAHTDGHDMAMPPKFFFLLCLQPSSKNDGLTELSNFSHLLRDLSQREVDILTNQTFSFETKPSSSVMKLSGVRAPIYDKERDILRYSYNYLSGQSSDPEIARLVERINQHHERTKRSVLLAGNDLLVCDNHRVLHSRSAFSGADRHLVRAWVN